MAPRIIARNLANPDGFIGRFVMGLMNHHNAAINRFAVERLQLRADDRVLEIGFGGGLTIPLILSKAHSVVGVDRSRTAVEAARRAFGDQVSAGRAEFHDGSAEALPAPDAAFDKACTVNTIYFWASLERGFAEIRRVLAPGGRLAVGFLPDEPMSRLKMPADVFTLRSEAEVTGALERVGFSQVTAARPDANTPWVAVTAEI
jgi:ubiquinone/menaquinone biosynthesis C-methylase UbiE